MPRARVGVYEKLIPASRRGGAVIDSASPLPALDPRPTFDADVGDQSSNELDVINLDCSATDPDADPLTYAATGLPAGLSINGSGFITGTISAGAAALSPYTVAVTVRDAVLPDAIDTFTWTVGLSTDTYLSMILARTGVLGAWFFGDDAGATIQDRSTANNDGSVTTGALTYATVSPIPDDTKTAATFDATDVVTIPHAAAYDRGNGPFSVEFWGYIEGGAAGGMLTEMLADTPSMLLRGNEPSGSTANDSSSGGARDGTLGSAVTFGSTVIVGVDTSMDFPGSGNSWVDVADHADFDRADGAWTMAAVIKRDTVAAGTIMTKGGTDGYSFRFSADGSWIACGTDTSDHAYGPLTSPDTDEHTYVATYDGTTHHIYEDGVDITVASSNPTYADNANTLRIGASHAGTNMVDGKFGYIGFYPTAASPTRVAAWHAARGGSGTTDHPVVSKSNFSSNGWVVESASSAMHLTDWALDTNIRQAGSSSVGWHHFVITRGTATNGKVYVDGADVTAVVGTKTFTNSAADLLVTVNGSIYGLVYYDRVVTAAEALESATYTYSIEEPPVVTTIQGFGSGVTGGEGQTITIAPTLSALIAAIGSNRTIRFNAPGTIDIPSDYLRIAGRQNMTLDGTTSTGKGIYFTGWPILIGSASSNIIIKNIHHLSTPSLAGQQLAQCVAMNPNATRIQIIHNSFSNFSDEAVTIWGSGNRDITVAHNIIRDAWDDNHAYPSVVGNFALRVTYYRNLMARCSYRQPAIGYDPTDVQHSPSLTAEVINNLVWDIRYDGTQGADGYGTIIYYGGRAHVIKNYYYNAQDPGLDTAIDLNNRDGQGARAFISGNYSKDGAPFPSSNIARDTVAAQFQVTEVSAQVAASQILDEAGCRVGGLDAADAALIASIRAVGL
jgi:hypothetical protein